MSVDGESRGEGTPLLVWLLMAAAGLIGAGWLFHAAYYSYQGGPDVGMEPQAAVTASEIVSRPNRYQGNMMIVTGQIAEAVGPQAFAMAADSGNLLVVFKQDAMAVAAPAPQETIRVTGVVQIADRALLENELSPEQGEAAIQQYEGRPVLIAESVSEA